jgi:hypothetical protein
MKTKILLLLIFGLFAFTGSTFSQGVTTSAIKGKIVDSKGEPIFAANVVAEHLPSGAQYGTITQEDGRFNIRNMRIGGPYKVSVSFIGYHTAEQTEIYLQLNKTSEIDIGMKESVEMMDEIVITYDADGLINSDRTGTMTNIGKDEIERMPSIKRSALDVTRLTPESDGNSFGGRNNLYNNFSLDGSIFNNSFGLDYATPGGQSDAQPVSLDAIEQIQVSLAPFDVREGGFTGAGVNAVTRSGTNEFSGTAYFFFRNEAFLGNKVGDVKSDNLDFNANLFGVSVGGPIIKNKLFFFVNYEGERRKGLAHGYVAQNDENAGQENVTSVNESDIQAVQSHLRDYWGYEPGEYQGYNHELQNHKFLVKFDYNINQKNKLSLRYNMLDAWKDILPHPEAVIGRGPTSFRLPFENSSYRIFNKIHSVVAELNSILSSKVSNNLLVGYTTFRDEREPHSEPFPVIDIFDANGNIAITMGSEMFSTHNRLNQDIFQFTDNVTIYMDRHTLTTGVNFELFKFENSFNLFYYPWNTFGSVQQFLDNKKIGDEGYDPETDIDFNQQVLDSQKNPYMWSYVNVAQLGLYVQDEFQANDKLNLTLGLRVELPFYLNSLEETDAVKEVINFDGWVDENGDSKQVNPANWPNTVPLWSPRFGFNWDIKGDKTTQLRGGTGIFTGRIPFVWLGNQSSNTGIYPGYTFQVNATTEKFRWPQVWKSTVAVDHKFGKGWTGTLETMYGKDLNAVVHRNYNMAAPGGQLSGTGDTRPVFTEFSDVNIYSSSEGSIGFLDAGTIVLDNTNEGHQYSLTAKLGKKWPFGLNANAAYTYMDSRDYTSIPAEIAADAFQRNPVVGSPNSPELSWSRYGLKHRVISSWFYTSSYSENFATSVGLFFEAAQGPRYSYVYAGDLNGDAIMNNDLLYVPNGADDIHFGTVDENGVGTVDADADAQWAALQKYIDQDEYLKERKGKYAERHGAQLPWYFQMDIRILQDFSFDVGGKKNTVQLSLDILNFPNLLNSSWGVYQLPRTTTPISVNGVDAQGTPYMHFDTSLAESYVNDFSNLSRWQLQIGIRYIFN